MQSLGNYKSHLEKLVKEDSSNILLNGGLEYASVFMTLLFTNTQKSVNMFCEGLNPAIIKGEVLDAIKNCIDRKVEVNILTETDEYVLSSAFSYDLMRSNVCIRKARKEDLDLIDKVLGPDRCHFTVCDEKMVRLEMKPAEYKAIGSFNKPEWAKALSGLFHEAFSKAEQITKAAPNVFYHN